MRLPFRVMVHFSDAIPPRRASATECSARRGGGGWLTPRWGAGSGPRRSEGPKNRSPPALWPTGNFKPKCLRSELSRQIAVDL